MSKKKCVYCNEEKILKQFPKHKHHFDGYDTRCKICIKKRNAIIKNIRKTSPVKPDICDCCGKKPINENGRRKVGLVLDHCPENNIFRGWICNHCNIGIGLLGDRINGLKKALSYLQKNIINICTN